MILLYAGRRPSEGVLGEENVRLVLPQVERAVRGLAPRLAVGSAAAGADLVVLEAALGLGLPARVVVAGRVDDFRSSSVADKGPEWGARYDAVVASDAVEVVEVPRVPGDDDASYRAVTARIWEEGKREPGPAVLLTLSGPPPGGGHTEELVARQLAAGGLALTIDPAATTDGRPRTFVATPWSGAPADGEAP
ncbi:MAG TPA: hypothetical protein VF520_14545 [Thermoleophilaceae bacterium]|jgi:hypothetical protein